MNIKALVFVCALLCSCTAGQINTGAYHSAYNETGLIVESVRNRQEFGIFPDRILYGASFGVDKTKEEEISRDWFAVVSGADLKLAGALPFPEIEVSETYSYYGVSRIKKTTASYMTFFIGHSLFRGGETYLNTEISLNVLSITKITFIKEKIMLLSREGIQSFTFPGVEFEHNLGVSLRNTTYLFENLSFFYEGVVKDDLKLLVRIGIMYGW